MPRRGLSREPFRVDLRTSTPRTRSGIRAMTALFSPFQLGPHALAHRVVMAPLTRMRTDPGEVPTPLMATCGSIANRAHSAGDHRSRQRGLGLRARWRHALPGRPIWLDVGQRSGRHANFVNFQTPARLQPHPSLASAFGNAASFPRQSEQRNVLPLKPPTSTGMTMTCGQRLVGLMVATVARCPCLIRARATRLS